MACNSCLNGCVTPQHCSCDCNTCAEANSCDIPVGDVGPQGPVGPMGPPGAPCIPCTNGVDGEDGCSLTDVYISDGTDGNTAGDVIVTTGTAAPCPQTLNAGNILTTILGPGGAVPAGVIVMWSGPVANIPTGWEFCDGNNGTPDLRGHFIGAYGQLAGHAPFNVLGATGGTFNINLAPNQIPAHTHGVGGYTVTSNVTNDIHCHRLWLAKSGAGTAQGSYRDAESGRKTTSAWQSSIQSPTGPCGTDNYTHNHNVSNTMGGQSGNGTPALSAPNGGNINITNKYYVLCFIMKM
jgi:microcystin-dependent protein